MLPLPIDEHIGAVKRALGSHRAVVVTAAPGAGKTTRVPPSLTAEGNVLLLQPRRVAARAIARRIAAEQGWTLGHQVGWQVRFDRNFSAATKLLVATEGILTARLQQDPLAGAFSTIVIDEFHERSIHADVGLALAREAWRARPDLRLVVMSATIDAARVARYLGDCPVVTVPGRQFSLDITYRPGVSVPEAVADSINESVADVVVSGAPGAILCFLPGAGEVRRAADQLARRISGRGVAILPLHGGLDADEQDAALQPRRWSARHSGDQSGRNDADGAGCHVRDRYGPPQGCAVRRRSRHRQPRDGAGVPGFSGPARRPRRPCPDRACRAALGRTRSPAAASRARDCDRRSRVDRPRCPGVGRRPTDARMVRAAAGGRARRGNDLLQKLDALDRHRMLTPAGQFLRRLPLHPRLGRMLLATRGDTTMARACALLSERHFTPPRHSATACDLLAAVDGDTGLPAHVTRAAVQIQRAASSVSSDVSKGSAPIGEREFRRAVLAGYPDRVARRRAGSHDRFVLASGAGARLARESGVVNHEFIVAVEVTSSGATGAEPLIRIATGIERDWIQPTAEATVHDFDEAAGAVRALRVERYGAIRLSEHPIAPDPNEAAAIVADEYLRRGPGEDDRALLRRLTFAGVEVTFEELVRSAAMGKTRLTDLDLPGALSREAAAALARNAPAVIAVPSGRSVPLDYRDGGGVTAAVKLQELFGLADSPRIGRARVPVTFELLSPAGRPVQVTNDLRSFWERGYPEVRKELRARYPKHPWPDDPWSATPTARPLRRRPR